jgi:predicted transcriptional regulator of viral defense system
MLSKNILIFQKLTEMPYFTVRKIAEDFKISPGSASVLCSRYSQKGLLVRLKNNLYTSANKLENIRLEELFLIANILQVPSYVSLMTALSFYGVTTQLQRDFTENVSVKRTADYIKNGIEIKYFKLKKDYYFDFVKNNGFFIATKEKAFLDSIYLYCFGKYKIDFSSLNVDKFDKSRLKSLINKYPAKTKKLVEKLCRI